MLAVAESGDKDIKVATISFLHELGVTTARNKRTSSSSAAPTMFDSRRPQKKLDQLWGEDDCIFLLAFLIFKTHLQYSNQKKVSKITNKLKHENQEPNSWLMYISSFLSDH